MKTARSGYTRTSIALGVSAARLAAIDEPRRTAIGWLSRHQATPLLVRDIQLNDWPLNAYPITYTLLDMSSKPVPADRPASPTLRSPESVYRELKRRILNNDYAPGTQVLEQTIANDLGLSRTPVREALVRLQHDGLVEVVPRHGIRVLPILRADMQEIYEVLASLEPTATELLARQNPSRERMMPLIEACDDMERALDVDNLEAWATADEKFHFALVNLCGNRRLAALVMTVWDQAHRARIFTLKLRPKPIESTREHRDVVDAILAGDAEKARNLYRAHRERAASALLTIIEQYGLVRL